MAGRASVDSTIRRCLVLGREALLIFWRKCQINEWLVCRKRVWDRPRGGFEFAAAAGTESREYA